jgi:hypothetical protein
MLDDILHLFWRKCRRRQVPSGAAGLVVGKKGAGIKRFKQQAGVKLSLPYGETSEQGMPNKTVLLEGTGESVEQVCCASRMRDAGCGLRV